MINHCHQYRARLAVTSVQFDQALYTVDWPSSSSYHDISKMIMDNCKSVRWNIPFKKFGLNEKMPNICQRHLNAFNFDKRYLVTKTNEILYIINWLLLCNDKLYFCKYYIMWLFIKSEVGGSTQVLAHAKGGLRSSSTSKAVQSPYNIYSVAAT